ncbi:hypothetical protein [Paracoccus sp. NSM]|uniref:hypothetical protein n=1 Tax=Paracoccus sp. NSM TaxID=3457784 RepID=UPI004035C378
MGKFLILAAVAAIAAGCAKSPDAIAPVSMGNAYAGVSCQSASDELTAARANLAALESAQRGAVAGDAIGVFLIGVPTSSLMGGDKAGQIATEKGRVIALESRLRSC